MTYRLQRTSTMRTNRLDRFARLGGAALVGGLLLTSPGCDRGVVETTSADGGENAPRVIASSDDPHQPQNSNPHANADPHANIDPHAGVPGMGDMAGMMGGGSDPKRATPPDDDTKVEFLGLMAPKPATWKWYPPETGMRAANFVLPAESGDNQAHLVIFQNIGGSPEANVQRWIGQFRNPDGGQVDAQSEKITVNGMEITLAEIRGDHMRMGAQWYTPDQTMLAAVLQAPQGPVQMLLTGPSETVERHRAGWNELIQGIRPLNGEAAPATETAGAAGPSAAAAADYSNGFPEEWYYQRDGKRYQHLIPLEGEPAPQLTLTNWIGDPVALEELKGKVVVVDFWGTWCPPCRASIPKNVDIAKRYEGDVVFLGVHDSKRGADRMPELAEQMGINYPLAVDVASASEQAWKVRFWPSYFVIDQEGVVRAAGIMPHFVEPAVEYLLNDDGTGGA